MSVTFCRKCQGLIEPGQPFCSRCFTPVRRGSLLGRVFGRLIEWCGGRMGVAGDVGAAGGTGGAGDGGWGVRGSTNITLTTSERIAVHDEATGQMREYASRDDLPAEMRARIEAAIGQGAFDGQATVTEQSITKRITTGPDGATRQEITVRGADGVERRYASVDDLPPELRRMIHKFRDV